MDHYIEISGRFVQSGKLIMERRQQGFQETPDGQRFSFFLHGQLLNLLLLFMDHYQIGNPWITLETNQKRFSRTTRNRRGHKSGSRVQGRVTRLSGFATPDSIQMLLDKNALIWSLWTQGTC